MDTNDREQFSPEFVAARAEIQHRIYQFCRGVDRLDLEYARLAFHDDAVDNHGGYKGDVDGLLDWVSGRHANIPTSYHHIGNICIDFASETDAFVESYVLTWQSVPPEGNLAAGGSTTSQTFEALFAARYVDHFTKRNGAWRIQKRVSFPDASVALPAPESGPMRFPDFARGTRDKDDPSQRLRAELGLSAVTQP